MPSRIHCPACQTGFAYSPALLGKTVQCRECAHRFHVAEPPLEESPAVLIGPARLSPPPLPAARQASSRPERPVAAEDRPLPRPVRREQSGSAVALIGLGAALVVGFVVLVGGVVYLLWPDSSKPTSPVADGPPPPVEPTMIDEPPKRLEDIRRQAPVREPGGPEEAGPVVPNFRPPIAPPVVPPVDWNPPRAGRPSVPLAPAFPQAMPAVPPRVAGDAPKFAPVTPLAIKPVTLDDDRKEVELPGPAASVTVAGGGKLLLLHVPKTKQVLVFDVSAAKVVQEIGIPEADVLVAGGMNTFVIYLPAKNAIERWSCDPLERQPGGKSPFTDPVKALAMGSASNGPVVAAVTGTRKSFNGGCTLAYYDPATLKEVSYTRSGDRMGGVGDRSTPAALRVSADGRVVTGWGPGGPTGAESNVIAGNQVTRRWNLSIPRPLLPATDGRVLFAPGQVVASNLPPDIWRQAGPVIHYVPAAHGNWYVGVQSGPGEVARGAAIHVYQVGRRVPVASQVADDVDLSRTQHGLDQSVILVPDARVLVTVAGPARDKLVLRRIDLK